MTKKLNQEVDYFLTFLDIGIERFQNNIWLPYYKAKLLHLVNRSEEAIEFLIPVVKEKISEYWTWSLLADLVVESDKETAFSCYCKSLLCKGEGKYIANVRVKLVELLIRKELWEEAKFEIACTINSIVSEGKNVPAKLRDYEQENWFKKASDKKSNNNFYNIHRYLAEEYVFHSLAWFDSCLGKTYTIPEKPDKLIRKLFIKLDKEIIEVDVSDRQFNTSKKL